MKGGVRPDAMLQPLCALGDGRGVRRGGGQAQAVVGKAVEVVEGERAHRDGGLEVRGSGRRRTAHMRCL